MVIIKTMMIELLKLIITGKAMLIYECGWCWEGLMVWVGFGEMIRMGGSGWFREGWGGEY